MGVSGQRYVRVLCVQKMRCGAHLHVFKGSAYNVRCDGIEGLLACLVLGLALHHLPQAKDYAAKHRGAPGIHEVIELGVEFSRAKRQIVGWEVACA